MLFFLSIRIDVSSVPKYIKDNTLSYILSKRFVSPLMTLKWIRSAWTHMFPRASKRITWLSHSEPPCRRQQEVVEASLEMLLVFQVSHSRLLRAHNVRVYGHES